MHACTWACMARMEATPTATTTAGKGVSHGKTCVGLCLSRLEQHDVMRPSVRCLSTWGSFLGAPSGVWGTRCRARLLHAKRAFHVVLDIGHGQA